MKRPLYIDGQPVQAGDLVTHAGQPAVVRAVLAVGEFASARDREEWSYMNDGFIVCETTTDAWFHYEYADEDLQFVARSDDERGRPIK
jgi:hypothetical protein